MLWKRNECKNVSLVSLPYLYFDREYLFVCVVSIPYGVSNSTNLVGIVFVNYLVHFYFNHVSFVDFLFVVDIIFLMYAALSKSCFYVLQ